jgi:hypothetical protein
MFKKILKGLAVFLVLVIVLFVTLIGPWPTYSSTGWASSSYYAKAKQDIAEHVRRSELTAQPGHLLAGWASADITPPVGTPMAGYGGRKGEKRSTGVRDRLEIEALALSDGKDTVVLIGADMLITPPNIAEGVRKAVAAQVPLSGDNILFNASHTHCSMGGWMKGIGPYITGGPYEPALPDFLIQRYTEAIVAAYKAMKPAKLASGSFEAAEYIRNRTRDAGVDPVFNYAVIEQEGGKRCYLLRYSAHPTIFGDDFMEFSAEYPGELRRDVERKTGEEAVYLGGAVGSMGPRAPHGEDPSARVTAMGQALAKLLLEAVNATELKFETNLDIASVGIPLGMPPLQMRPFPNSTRWRLSPFLVNFLGFPIGGWIHGAKVGSLLFMGMPCDFSGEISVDWRAWAAERHAELWTLSFCSTYCGYFSPDRYYLQTPLGYEVGMMNWYGPDTEAYFTALFHDIFNAMMTPPGSV